MPTHLPKEFLSSLESLPGYDATAFAAVHASGDQVTSIRLNPAKLLNLAPDNDASAWLLRAGLHSDSNVPWSSYGYYLGPRPFFTYDPLLHAGVYYVQEASSMFLEQALLQTTDLSGPLRVLDLCAAPGGKSTLLQSLLSPDSLLVSNEVIRNRVSVLRENSIKWGGANTVITSNDPQDFSILENYFDVLVVDAPCSGSGLFRRDPEAVAEWSRRTSSSVASASNGSWQIAGPRSARTASSSIPPAHIRRKKMRISSTGLQPALMPGLSVTNKTRMEYRGDQRKKWRLGLSLLS